MRSIRWIAAALLLSAGVARAADRELDQGLHQMVRGDYRQAEPLLRASVERNPHDAQAHFSLGSTLRDLGRGPEALAEFEQAIRLAGPNDQKLVSDARYGIALCRDGMGDPAAAVGAWQQYLDQAGGRPEEQGAIEVARERVQILGRQAGERAP